ncbi:murein L,D-transpeptidase [Veronia nyctiphanis]|uniref:Murein L,D-transpeptidase n=2 Tax=Veronia nyctiphanis TaxID=1278244 RepID=A0A4Q0YUD3_9GAMM|nr:murein L,D-transpeptidase [Veronia nyctiphanis]
MRSRFWTLVLVSIFISSATAVELTGEKAVPVSDVAWIDDVEGEVGHLVHKKLLTSLYFRFSYQPLWIDGMAKDELETQVNVISLSGISTEFAWRATVLRDAKMSADWRVYDVFATDTLLSLMSYNSLIAERGRDWLFGKGVDIELPLPDFQQVSQLVNAASRNGLYPYIDSLRPQPKQYWAMVKAIISLQELEPLHWPTFQQKGLIKPKYRLNKSDALITSLMRHGVLDVSTARRLIVNQTDRYVPELVEAVRRFQTRHGLKSDGVIGSQTKKWLNKTPKDRVKLIALNIERMRYWPVKTHQVIFVNIPGYELDLWMDDKVVLNSKVIVGRPSRKTPIFNAHVNSVVLNPHWNVPIKIMRKDILPKASRDSNYLTENRYRVLNSWVKSTEIPVEDIDWTTFKPHTFPYRLQQAPGKQNALGLYKFNIPNNNAIYLHDTPAKSLFDEGRRAFSSGCVRVEQAQVLAELLLHRSGLEKRRYAKYKKTFTTKQVSLKERIDVHAIYQTAWVNAQGNVEYRDDVYQYDIAPEFERTQLDWPPTLLTKNQL